MWIKFLKYPKDNIPPTNALQIFSNVYKSSLLPIFSFRDDGVINRHEPLNNDDTELMASEVPRVDWVLNKFTNSKIKDSITISKYNANNSAAGKEEGGPRLMFERSEKSAHSTARRYLGLPKWVFTSDTE